MTDELPTDLQTLDTTLAALFADARPGVTLEDRTVRGLRSDTHRRIAFSGWQRAVAAGLAASVGLGLVGTSDFLDRLPFPGGTPRTDKAEMAMVLDSSGSMGDSESSVRLRLRRNHFGDTDGDKPKDLTNRDQGLESKFKAAIQLGREKGGEEVRKKLDDFDAPGRPGTMGDDFAVSNGTNREAVLYFVPGTPEFAMGKQVVSGTTRFASDGPVKLNEAGERQGPVIAGQPVTAITGGTLSGNLHNNLDGKPGKPEAFYRESNKDYYGYQSVDSPTPRPVTSPQLNLLQNTKGTETAPPPAPPNAPVAAAVRKIVIRTGEIEFEIDSFDSAYATVQQIVGKVNGAFVGTVNSDKLPNGKVKGAIVVRIPPEHLDALVLELRRELGKVGELKGQRIAAQDITKQYTDLESRLTAARTMEKRLLKIIEEGKGEIKLLLEAEKELGVWRTKIEEAEGELRYYASQVSLSTLTIALVEKEIRTAAGLTESERVQAGVEVEDVDAAYRDILKAVSDAKGRTSKAELKQHAAGQFSATLHFEASPDAAGPLRDKLRMIGRMARLDIDRVQTADAGGTPVPKDAKVKRGDTAFFVELYNLANVQPRETVVQQVAAADVKASYQTLQNAVAKVKGRVLKATLNDAEADAATAQFQFEVNRKDEGDVLAALSAAGESVSRSVSRAPESDRTTDSKIRFDISLMAAGTLRPRETTAVTVEVADVDGALAAVAGRAAEAKAKVLDQTITRDREGKVTAKVVFSAPLSQAAALTERIKAAGVVRAHDASRDAGAIDGPAAMARVTVTLTNVDPIVASDDGIWPQIRKGLSHSAAMLLKSVTFVVVGACFVLPWALIVWGCYRLFRRRKVGG